MHLARLLAQFAFELEHADLPPAVVEKAKEVVLHSWGIQLAASTLPWSAAVYQVMREQRGAPHATIVRFGTRTSVADAVMVNGTFAHGFELDDNHTRTALKGGCVAVPTAVAVGEHEHSTGRDVIAAVAAGFEVMLRMGLLLNRCRLERGGHTTGMVGALGAAVIAGKLMGADREQMVNSLSCAAATVIGSIEVAATGRGHLKRIFGGTAAAGGVHAAQFAMAGLTAPETMLDPGRGLCRIFGMEEDDAPTRWDDLGSRWEFLDVGYKIYAQDGYIQPMTQALEEIRSAHRFEVDDVEAIVVGTSKHAHDEVVGRIRSPSDLTDAQFSANFSLALFLCRGGAGFREYDESALQDSTIREVSRRIEITVDEEVEREYQRVRPRGARVAVILKSGERYRSYVRDLRTPSSRELDDKFRQLATVVLDERNVDEIQRQTHQLEDVHDVSALLPLLVHSK